MTKSKLNKYIDKLELQADNLSIGIAQLGKIILVMEGEEVVKKKKVKDG